MGDLQSEFFQRKGIIKNEVEMTKEELQQDYKQRRAIALIGEGFRDIPTIAFLYFGGAEISLAYYAGATWLADRWAYFVGCAGQ